VLYPTLIVADVREFLENNISSVCIIYIFAVVCSIGSFVSFLLRITTTVRCGMITSLVIGKPGELETQTVFTLGRSALFTHQILVISDIPAANY
jgi:hypothetical protein